MRATIAATNQMEQTTAINHAITKLMNHQLGKYQTSPDDPMLEVTKMFDRIETIKDSIPQSVTQSLDLAGKKLETQFSLVSKPLLESLAVQQAHLGTVQHQLASLEKRFINAGHVAAPAQSWNSWLILGCTFTMLGLLGYNTVTARNLAWAQTPTGYLAKQMIDRNPKLGDNCRPLSAKESKQIKMQDKPKQICSLFL